MDAAASDYMGLEFLWDGQKLIVPPLALGVIFTIATVGLLITSLKKYVPFVWAILAGILLASIPFYILHGTSQYADIEAAFFILMSSVLAIDLFKSPSVKTAVMTGLSLGITASVKDNSIVAAIVLMILIVLRLRQLGLMVFVRPLCWGFVAIAVSVVLMRSFEFFLFL